MAKCLLLATCVAFSLSCTHSGKPLPGPLYLLQDTCQDSDPDFRDRMTELASSVWQANDGRGDVKYVSFERVPDGQCGISSGFYVELDKDGAGSVIVVKVEMCSHADCEMTWEVGK